MYYLSISDKSDTQTKVNNIKRRNNITQTWSDKDSCIEDKHPTYKWKALQLQNSIQHRLQLSRPVSQFHRRQQQR